MTACKHVWTLLEHRRARGTAGASGRGKTVPYRRCCRTCGKSQRRTYPGRAGRAVWETETFYTFVDLHRVAHRRPTICLQSTPTVCGLIPMQVGSYCGRPESMCPTCYPKQVSCTATSSPQT
jgi:hypothetical protein